MTLISLLLSVAAFVYLVYAMLRMRRWRHEDRSAPAELSRRTGF
jgi:hypothetical protein